MVAVYRLRVPKTKIGYGVRLPKTEKDSFYGLRGTVSFYGLRGTGAKMFER